MLPEGYTGAEGEDLFDESSWGGQSGTGAGESGGAEPGQEPAQPPTQDPPPAEEGAPAPTTGQEAQPVGDAGTASQEAPTTGQQGMAPGKLKFKARVDHQDRDVEVDESDLPNLYQKAQITERAQAKEAQTASRLTMAEEAARRAGFDGLDSLLESVTKSKQEAEVKRLTMEGVHEDVAKDMAARKFAAPRAEPAQQPTAPGGGAPARDFRAEVTELLTARPELKGKPLPQEVLAATAKGKPLMAAFYEHEAGQARAEAERLRQENEIMKQNAANAARAPVSGTQGGGAPNNKPEDDFLRGFNEDY